MAKIKARDIRGGMTLVGLGGYVFEDPETGNGYLTYPSTGLGYAAAMPDDTVVITFHDDLGEECYLIVHPDFEIEVS